MPSDSARLRKPDRVRSFGVLQTPQDDKRKMKERTDTAGRLGRASMNQDWHHNFAMNDDHRWQRAAPLQLRDGVGLAFDGRLVPRCTWDTGRSACVTLSSG